MVSLIYTLYIINNYSVAFDWKKKPTRRKNETPICICKAKEVSPKESQGKKLSYLAVSISSKLVSNNNICGEEEGNTLGLSLLNKHGGKLKLILLNKG